MYNIQIILVKRDTRSCSSRYSLDTAFECRRVIGAALLDCAEWDAACYVAVSPDCAAERVIKDKFEDAGRRRVLRAAPVGAVNEPSQSPPRNPPRVANVRDTVDDERNTHAAGASSRSTSGLPPAAPCRASLRRRRELCAQLGLPVA